MVPATIKYRKAGVQPPVFVAGSFSDPEWVPREMDWVLNDRGESFFTKEIEIQADRDYQYKFKIGYGNDWDLDEQSPTTLDSIGNTNNLLTVPSGSLFNDDQNPPATGDATYSPLVTPSKLVETVSSTDVQSGERDENNSGIKHLIAESNNAPRSEASVDETEDIAVPATPLFSHECLEAHDFEVIDDTFDHSLLPKSSRGLSSSSLGALAQEHTSPDIDDPMLEQFPCDKPAIFDTLRRISTSMEGPIPLETQPLSPQFASRRDSFDSVTDSIPSSPNSLSPTSSRKRDSRLSHSSIGQTRSAVSLGSIIEEPPRKAVTSFPGPTMPAKEDDGIGLASEDEGPFLKDHQVDTQQSIKQSLESQASSASLSTRNPDKPASGTSKSSKRVSRKAGGDSPVEGRWFITGGVILLALGITLWKSCRG